MAKDLRTPYRPQAERSQLPEDGSDPLLDRDGVHEIYRQWRQVLDEYDPPRSAVAEAWVQSSRRMLYARSDELGQAFNFDLLKAPFDAASFRALIADNLALATAAGTSSTWVLSNHDMVRHPTRYSLPTGTDLDAWTASDGHSPLPDSSLGLRRARAATLLMLALPGSAYLYQGEELGLPEVADLPTESLRDPVWRRSGHSRKGRDGCRVPLPWDESIPAYGFGTVPPWLPQPSLFAPLSVAAQRGQDGSTLELYRRALALRRRLQHGEDLTWAATDSADVVAFERQTTWRSTTNFGPAPVPLPPGDVLVSSGPLTNDTLPADTTVWTRPPISSTTGENAQGRVTTGRPRTGRG